MSLIKKEAAFGALDPLTGVRISPGLPTPKHEFTLFRFQVHEFFEHLMLQRPTELLNLALLDLTPIDNRSVRHCQKFAYLETP
jgi:hypothetical protein